MNKKTIGIIVGIVLGIGLIVLSATIKPKTTRNLEVLSNDMNVIIANAEKESANVKEEEKKDFININVNQYLEYYQGSEKRIILLARPTCHYCQIAEPIIQKVAKDYNLDINYLNTDEFTEEDQQAFVNSDERFSSGFGTPFMMIVQNSGIIDSVDGLTDYAHYVYLFRKNSIIK